MGLSPLSNKAGVVRRFSVGCVLRPGLPHFRHVFMTNFDMTLTIRRQIIAERHLNSDAPILSIILKQIINGADREQRCSQRNCTNNRHSPPQPTKGSAIRLLFVISACVPFSYSVKSQSSNYPHCAFHLPTLASRTCTNTATSPWTIDRASTHRRLASSTELPVCRLGRPARL